MGSLPSRTLNAWVLPRSAAAVGIPPRMSERPHSLWHVSPTRVLTSCATRAACGSPVSGGSRLIAARIRTCAPCGPPCAYTAVPTEGSARHSRFYCTHRFPVIADAQQPPGRRAPRGSPPLARTLPSAAVGDGVHTGDVSGHTLHSILAQLHPPFPVLHTGVIARPIGDTAQRPSLRAAALRRVHWQSFHVLAASRAVAPHRGRRDLPAFLRGLPPSLSPLLARHLYVSASHAACVPAVHGARLSRLSQAPSLYGACVLAPLCMAPSALRACQSLCCAVAGQRWASLLLLEERPVRTSAACPADPLLPLRRRPEMGTALDGANAPGAAPPDSPAVRLREVRLTSEPQRPIETRWAVRARVPTVSLLVTLATERIPLMALRGSGATAAEPRVGASAAAVRELRLALRSCQHEYLRHRATERSETAPTGAARAQDGDGAVPWVWAGEQWQLELDPQLQDVSFSSLAAADSPSVPARDVAVRPASPSLELPILAWVSPHQSCGIASLACCEYTFSVFPVTLLLDKEWVVAPAGTLAHLLSTAPCTPLPGDAQDERRREGEEEEEGEQPGDSTGNGRVSWPPPPPRDAASDDVNRLLYFPNYDARSGLPFLPTTETLLEHLASEPVRDETRRPRDPLDTEGRRRAAPSSAVPGVSGADVQQPADDPLVVRGATKKVRTKDLQRLTVRAGELQSAAVSTLNPFQLAYGAQACCWIQESCLQPPVSSPRADTVAPRTAPAAPPLQLGDGEYVVPMRRLSSLCDPLTSSSSISASMPPSTAAASLRQEKHFAGFFLSTLPAWFAEAVDAHVRTPRCPCPSSSRGNGLDAQVTDSLCALLPSIVVEQVEVHGVRRGVAGPAEESGLVYVLQVTPQWCAADASVAAPGAAEGLAWHAYHAEDVRVNFQWAVHAALARQMLSAAVEEDGAPANSTAQSSSMLRQLFSPPRDLCNDVLFMDVRAAIGLLARSAAAGDSHCTNAIADYQRSLPPFDGETRVGNGGSSGSTNSIPIAHDGTGEDGRAAPLGTRAAAPHGVHLSYGATHFVDDFVRRVRQPVCWTFEELQEMLSRATAPYDAVANESTAAEDSAAENAAGRDGKPPLSKEEEEEEARAEKDLNDLLASIDVLAADEPEGDRTGGPTDRAQDSFLRELEVRHVDTDGVAHPYGPLDGELRALEHADDTFRSSHPLVGHGHSVPPEGAIIDFPAVDRRELGPGARLYEAFTHPSELARLATVEAVTLGPARAEAIRAANESACRARTLLTRHGDGWSPRRGRPRQPHGAGDSGGGSGDGFDGCVEAAPDSPAAEGSTSEAVAVERVVHAERTRTAERWRPWMRLLLTDHRTADAVDEASCSAARALQLLISSPLCEQITRAPADRCTDATEPGATVAAHQQHVRGWDVGLVVLQVRPQERYINGMNTTIAPPS